MLINFKKKTRRGSFQRQSIHLNPSQICVNTNNTGFGQGVEGRRAGGGGGGGGLMEGGGGSNRIFIASLSRADRIFIACRKDICRIGAC